MMKILIADDSVETRKALVLYLSTMGVHDITCVEDGVQAVAAARDFDFDLVLMDQGMPNLMGIEAVRSIRAQGKTMPIIMISAEKDDAFIQEAIRIGVDHYITKPFASETLKTAIQRVTKAKD